MKAFTSILFIGFFAVLTASEDEKQTKYSKRDSHTSIPDSEKFLVTKTCYMDIEIDEESAGRIVIGLFGEVAENTANNFASLCRGNYNGELGFGFRGTNIHRIVKDFIIQGGDITANDGTGGKSIYGPVFSDEPFIHKHANKGYVSMANKGRPNTNGSQFFIVMNRFRWLNGKHVVFGKVIEGMELVDQINEMDSDPDTGKPDKEIRIADSGLIKHEPYVLPEELR